MTTDEQSIHEIVRKLEAAWNASDSESFIAPFVEDANFIQIYGGQLDGRRAIEGSHRYIFDTIYKGSQASFMLRGIRFVRPDVAIAFTQTSLKVKEGSQTREIAARPTLVVVKDAGKWQIVALQNTKISEMPAEAQAASRLAT